MNLGGSQGQDCVGEAHCSDQAIYFRNVIKEWPKGSGMRVDPPTTFLVLSYLAIALIVALLVAMWHPSTSEHLRATRSRVDRGAV